MIQNYFEDFRDFISLLKKYEVEYMIVGGYAVSIYSQPRSTQDIDVWIKSTKENAEKVLKVIDEFGFGYLGITLIDLTDEYTVVQLGNPPIRIDLMSSIDGVEFAKAYKNKSLFSYFDITGVSYISLEDLIKNKKSSGRNKDFNDINWLEKYGKDSKEI